ncbi:hypothetical protein BOTBODRAFT_173311 [Botryobasidium botryosum FD-172 SS1]|uniref:GPR1/FUN34/yaaH family protein n=1 Tax=Botryobasidium botryosum (strain FD-172 SS1) TaxID=930990 RepID=A0A067MJS7_BOTB1|nr:hypothetical protein BOTBODRAFT_173311 [Botryobasidium botryosum FD-172 SS1]
MASTSYDRNGVGARGGAFDNAQPGFPAYNRRIANPGPLGLYAFAVTTFIWSLFAVHTRRVYESELGLAMSLAVGGLVQLLAGMWAFPTGNTFAATMFSIYGAFYLSLGIIYWPGSGLIDSYLASHDLNRAMGIYLTGWFVLTTLMFFAAFRASITLVLLFFSMMMGFMLGMIGEYLASYRIMKASAAFGFITTFLAFWLGSSGLFTREHHFFQLPVGHQLRNRNTDTVV